MKPGCENCRISVSAKDRGAVLLTTLLIMAIMATLAIAIFDELRVAIKRAGTIHAYAQADWYARGAEDFAQSHLQGLFGPLDPDVLTAALQNPNPIIFPVEGGTILMRIRDGGDCLSVNAIEQTSMRLQFQRLLTVLGWDIRSATQLTARMKDWRDTDSQPTTGGAEDFTYLGQTPSFRTANTEFSSILDLRALDGMNEEMFQRLRPFICTRPTAGSALININSLTIEQAPILASVLSSDTALDIAEAVIANRPQTGYPDQNALQTSAALEDVEGQDIAYDRIGYTVEHIWVETEVRIGDAVRFGAFEFSIDGSRLQRGFKRYTDELFRPVILTRPDLEAGL